MSKLIKDYVKIKDIINKRVIDIILNFENKKNK